MTMKQGKLARMGIVYLRKYRNQKAVIGPLPALAVKANLPLALPASGRFFSLSETGRKKFTIYRESPCFCWALSVSLERCKKQFPGRIEFCTRSLTRKVFLMLFVFLSEILGDTEFFKIAVLAQKVRSVVAFLFTGEAGLSAFFVI